MSNHSVLRGFWDSEWRDCVYARRLGKTPFRARRDLRATEMNTDYRQRLFGDVPRLTFISASNILVISEGTCSDSRSGSCLSQVAALYCTIKYNLGVSTGHFNSTVELLQCHISLSPARSSVERHMARFFNRTWRMAAKVSNKTSYKCSSLVTIKCTEETHRDQNSLGRYAQLARVRASGERWLLRILP